MRFVFKKKVLSSIMAATMAAGFAASQNAAAIHLAEEGIGQVLLAPLYFAAPGYVTKFAIVNTRNDMAVKAKVVLRSQVTSAEVLDFICYLTPADVCRFEIRNENGKATLWSDDDSVKNHLGGWASQQPMVQTLFSQSLGAGDTTDYGHVEIIGAYGIQLGTTINTGQAAPNNAVQITRPMAKPALAAIFDAGAPNGSSRPILTALNGREVPCTSLPCTNTGLIRSADPEWVRLSGSIEISTTSGSDRMGYRIPALAGEIGDNVAGRTVDIVGYSLVQNNGGLQTGTSTADGRVISNPDFDADVSSETALGFGWGGVFWGVGGTLGSINGGIYDNLLEIEQALAVTQIKGSYEDDSLSVPAGVNNTKLVVTFPTKYRHWESDPCAVDNGNGTASNVSLLAPTNPATGNPYPRGTWPATSRQYSAPFSTLGVPYTLTAYDNQEHSVEAKGSIVSGGPRQATEALPSEVNYFIPRWPASTSTANYESGWFNLNLLPAGDAQTCFSVYRNVPALAMLHKYKVNGNGGMWSSWLTPAAHAPELNRRVGDVPAVSTAGE